MNKLKISVIMSCYNESSNYLKQAIDSILNQSFKKFEFIIILDDPKNKELENLILKYKKRDNRIIFIKNIKNIGLAHSLNRGLEFARGKYIVRMDADDISRNDRLKIQFDFIEKHKKVDLLFSWVKYIDENNVFVEKFKPSQFKIVNIENYFLKEHLLVHPTLFCKSEILKNNLYDSKQKKSQDFELWIRLISEKYNFDVIKELLLEYRILNKDSVDERIYKIKNFNYWTLRALNVNFKCIKYMKSFHLFYFKAVFLKLFLKLPVIFIKALVLIKDRFIK